MTPLLMVPGLLCTAEIFAAQITALWPYGPVTVASTLVGETMAEMAEAILRDAPPEFCLVGISMGGYLCFEILRQAPERVLKLALLDTTARPDTAAQTLARRGMVAGSHLGDFGELVGMATTMLLHPARRDDAELRAVNARMGLAVGREGFARQQRAIMGRVDSRPMLAEIRVPTLVLVGDGDPITPPDRAEEMANAIPGAKLVVVPDCGHCSTIEQPEAVNAALVEWIRA
jgi:pimeloyl-ACP methyl ester carboxylesterase